MLSRRSAVVLVACSAASCSLFTFDSEGGSGPCPSGMAHVSNEGARGFCIDRWEASTVELKGRGEEAPHSPFDPVTNLSVKAVARAGVVPQGYISQNEADLACKAARKRLCTGDEWQLACRGRTPTTFPYGDERKDGYCNDSGRAPLTQLHPGIDVFQSHEAMNDPRINRAPHTVAKTGSFSKCKNAFGVYDMVGNLHEWTADMIGSHGVFRGGYYQDTSHNGDGCKYKTAAHDPSYHDYSTGFRCCADAR